MLASALHSLKMPRAKSPSSSGLPAMPSVISSQNVAQALDPPLRRIAGNDGAVDRPDRDAGDPVRQIAVLRQGLVDAGLIGAERAAALQHETDLPAVRGQGFPSLARFALRGRRRGLAGARVGPRFSPTRVVGSILHGLEHLPVGVADSLARLLQPANGCRRQNYRRASTMTSGGALAQG